MKHQCTAWAIAWILALTILSPAVHADWLVTQDGSRLETQGEWRVEGRRVIFTLANGTLSAMRLSEVDLEKSRAATEEASRPPKEPVAEDPKAPKPEPILVLTNKDIPKATLDAEQEPQDNGGAPSASAGLRVIDWNLQPYEGGVILIGRLENGTRGLLSGIRLRVEVRNEEDEVLARASSTLAQESLVSGGITVFRARFAGFQELPGTPHFVMTAPGLETPDESAAGAESENGDGGDNGAP